MQALKRPNLIISFALKPHHLIVHLTEYHLQLHHCLNIELFGLKSDLHATVQRNL